MLEVLRNRFEVDVLTGVFLSKDLQLMLFNRHIQVFAKHIFKLIKYIHVSFERNVH